MFNDSILFDRSMCTNPVTIDDVVSHDCQAPLLASLWHTTMTCAEQPCI